MGLWSDLRQAIENLAQASQPYAAPVYSGGRVEAANPYGIPATLNESVLITLDGSGNGTAQITPPGPRMSGPTWTVGNVAVQQAIGTPVKNASGRLYFSQGIRSASDTTDFVAATVNASLGANIGANVTMRPGDWITFKWTGGDSGAVVAMVIKGTVNIPGT